MASAEAEVVEAEEETAKAIGADEDDENGTTARRRARSVMGSDQEYLLESTAKKARKAGDSVPQVGKSTVNCPTNTPVTHSGRELTKMVPSKWT